MMDSQRQDKAVAYIDMEEALGRVRGNKKLYRRMLGMFLASSEFSALEESLAQEDYLRAADLAHGIKGMTGNLSLNKLYLSSAHMMEILRQGQPDQEALAEYRAAYTQTRVEVERLLETLDEA